MSTDQSFLHAIAQQPDDDALRLVFADWLMEHGDAARGEFVQAQVELACLALDDPRRPALEDRADDLLAEHEERWLAPIPPALAGWRWRRGLLDRVYLRSDPALASLPALLERHPLARVHVDVKATEVEELAHSPHLGFVTGLSPHSSPRIDGFAALLAQPGLAGLRTLNVKYCLSLDQLLDLAPTLAFAPHLHGLEVGDGGDEAATRLVHEDAFPTLRELSVGRVGPHDVLPAMLLQPPIAARWTRLETADWQLRDLRELGDCVNLTTLRLQCQREPLPAPLPPALQRLELNGSGIERVLRELAVLPTLPPLRWLSVYISEQRNAFSSSAWHALDDLLRRLPGCRLRLWLFGGSGNGLMPFLTLPCRARLQSLLVNQRALTDAEFEALAGCEQLTVLRELYVSYPGTSFDESQARRLGEAPWLAGLRSLSLIKRNLGPEPLEILLRSPHLRRLRSLTLDHCGIGARGLAALANWPGFARLRWLSLGNNHLRASEATLLERSALSPLVRLVLQGEVQGDQTLHLDHLDALRIRLGERLLDSYSHDDYCLREPFYGSD